jgi:hypothetical protein
MAAVLDILFCKHKKFAVVPFFLVYDLFLHAFCTVPMRSRRVETAHTTYMDVFATDVADIVEAWSIAIGQGSSA